ncbi:MAG: ABC transporter permease subunit [Firmicutes bacterium]|nr:ABC transporter permease subunit [Bacillota bacterium]
MENKIKSNSKIKRKSKRKLIYFLVNLFLLIFALSVLIPVLYMIVISFGKNVMSLETGVLPKELTLKNYYDLFTKHQFLDWIKNSLIISLGTMVLTVVLTSLGAYTFSRLDFYGKKVAFNTILLIQIFPVTLSMVAIHQILNALGLLNKIISLILVDTVMALAGLILLAKGYFDTIPKELEESAFIDGANKGTVLVMIIIPLVKPMLAVIAVQSFVLAYNEYVIANVVMTGGFKSMPLAVGLRSMFEGQYGINWPRYCAAALIGSLPMLVLFFTLQQYFISGLTEGSVKQ